jgi:hypothetical protein
METPRGENFHKQTILLVMAQAMISAGGVEIYLIIFALSSRFQRVEANRPVAG